MTKCRSTQWFNSVKRAASNWCIRLFDKCDREYECTKHWRQWKITIWVIDIAYILTMDAIWSSRERERENGFISMAVHFLYSIKFKIDPKICEPKNYKLSTHKRIETKTCIKMLVHKQNEIEGVCCLWCIFSPAKLYHLQTTPAQRD